MEGQFKQCPKGHYYQGDHCPYCRTKKQRNNIIHKVCANGHCYEHNLTMCPYCDDKEVVDYVKNIMEETVHFIPIHIIENEKNNVEDYGKNITITVNDRVIENYECIYVFTSFSTGYKLSYEITSDLFSKDGHLAIKPDDKILIGRTALTGKEFIKLCDIVINNHLIIKTDI